MALHLARPKQRLHSNPSLIHLFSTTSSSSPQDGTESSEHPSQPPSSTSSPSDFKIPSYFSGIKSSLKQTQAQDGRRQFVRFDAKAQNPSLSLPGNQIGGRIQDIRRNLNEFRSRAAAPPLTDLQDLYKQNVLSKSGDSYGTRKIEGTPYANIKENLRQMRPQANTESKWANLSVLQNTMKRKFNENLRSNVIGGEEGLPFSVFGKELEEGKNNQDEAEEMKSEFFKSYDPIELGEKLRLHRPEGKKEGWFSLQELNQRLVKLRAMEEAQRTTIARPSIVKELMSEIQKSKVAEAQKSVAFQKLYISGFLSGTPKYMLEPPKEQLVETYLHPDNMSSAEKMKIELAKVREEFKMSESDCGSARVQVAQLTTKIKHLSSVLHKKDKHSRKGLIAMVQRRKKLLKYMRRTDWDSYCLSLSKLGLRDNPDSKF